MNMSAAATLIMIFNRCAVLVAYYLNKILSYRGLFYIIISIGDFLGSKEKNSSFFGCANPHFSIPADGCLLFGDPKEESFLGPNTGNIKTEVTKTKLFTRIKMVNLK